MTGFSRSFYQITSSFFVSFLLLAFVFFQSEGLEGGMDSWQHYLISRYAINYPELLLDQWNKPVFTWLTVFICQLPVQGLVWFNILCTLFSGLLMALSVRNRPYAWTLIPMTVFSPVLLGNTISGLTEPLNALLLALVLFLYAHGHKKSSVAVSSLLPFVRTEGFVICGALFLFLLLRREFKLIPWLIAGTLLMNTAGWFLSGEPFWIITSNPYVKFEMEGAFDPGSGSLLHYVNLARPVFGLPLLLMFLIYHISRISKWKHKPGLFRPESPAFLIFWFYFTAHTLIYYLGILGSHGLTRVMAVPAPAFAYLAYLGLTDLTEWLNRRLNRRFDVLLFGGMTAACIWAGYGENDYAKPYRLNRPSVKADKSLVSFEQAGIWLDSNKLLNRPIVHQSPYFNVRFQKDPYNPQSSYYIWSIDQHDDWAAKGTIVIWDGFSAVREGNMQLSWLQSNPAYRELHRIRGKEHPEHNPVMFDVVIFEKIR